MGPRLGDVCSGRDNNFNLIRMVAATAVLVSHAYPIALGSGARQPLEALAGRTLGWVAVAVFFAISGFLIARSFDNKRRLADWFAARAMRLFPALIVVVLLTVLLLGPAVTTRPLPDYFGDPATGMYVLRNITLVSLQFDLPGVFADQPYPGAINGSLWTLIHEVLCYGGVLVVGLAGLLRRPRLMGLALGGYALVYAGLRFTDLQTLVPAKALRLCDLSLPFALGVAFYVWRMRLRLSWLLSGGLAGAALLLRGTPLFAELFVVWVSYTTFVAAYLPTGWIRNYNQLGDYSYGIYIYAFPTQQLAVYALGPMSPPQNMAIAFPIALGFALLSWRLVEKPALAARHGVADALAALTRGRAPIAAADAAASEPRPNPRSPGPPAEGP